MSGDAGRARCGNGLFLYVQEIIMSDFAYNNPDVRFPLPNDGTRCLLEYNREQDTVEVRTVDRSNTFTIVGSASWKDFTMMLEMLAHLKTLKK